MKAAIVNVNGKPSKRKALYKDFSNGFGTGFWVGNSLKARFLEFSKRTLLDFPPPSLGYIAAILSKAGHEVEYVENKVIDCDLAIIKSSMVDYKAEIAFASRYRNETSAKIGFVGPFAGQMPELFLKEADFVIKGESESAMMKIAAGKTPKQVEESTPIKNLDSLPFPDWSSFPVKRYRYGPSLKERPVLPVLASRGCVYSCPYCPYLVDSCWRKRSAENVLDEIEHNVKEYGIKGLLFRDPLFAGDKMQAEAIAKGMIARGIKLPWICETRLDRLGEKTIDLFYKAGLRSVNVGIESPNQAILKSAGRNDIVSEKQKKIVDQCEKKGIKVTAFFILGLPEDTVESVNQTIEFAKELNINVASFRICTPYPGTRFFESVKDKICADWQDFDTYTPVFKHKNLSKSQLLKLKEKAFVQCYFRPKFILNFARRNIL